MLAVEGSVFTTAGGVIGSLCRRTCAVLLKAAARMWGSRDLSYFYKLTCAAAARSLALTKGTCLWDG